MTHSLSALSSESRALLQSFDACVDSLYLSVMTTARLIHASTTSHAMSSATTSSNSDLITDGESPPLSDETSPLLKPKNTHAYQSSIPGKWRSALSSFFNDNAGLLLVMGAQVFFSAMNLSVKVLNSLDEPVPTLEV